MSFAPIAGIAVLALLTADVFRTVFHAQGRFGPLNRVQNRLVWGAFRLMGRRRDGSPRDRTLALAAPVMIVMTLGGWVVLLTLGFALVYLPFIDDFIFSSGASRGRWVEALYFSGYSASTLGIGDMVPDRPSLRILTTIQAFSGFALMTVSITYLLATYSELIRMKTLAAHIAVYFRANDVGSEAFLHFDGYSAMGSWAETTTSTLLHVLEAHFQYPVLHYFRSPDEQRALPVQLGRLLDLEEIAGAAGKGERHHLRDHPSFRALSGAVHQYIEEVDRHFLPGPRRTHGEETKRAHGRLLSYMRYR